VPSFLPSEASKCWSKMIPSLLTQFYSSLSFGIFTRQNPWINWTWPPTLHTCTWGVSVAVENHKARLLVLLYIICGKSWFVLYLPNPHSLLLLLSALILLPSHFRHLMRAP
jgi:hypothetical protein